MRALVVPSLLFLIGCAGAGREGVGYHGMPPGGPAAAEPATATRQADRTVGTEEALPTGRSGPRAERFGIRTVLLGNANTPNTDIVPALGTRVFLTDAVALNTRAGMGVTWGSQRRDSGYQAGIGLSVYRRATRARLHPFFDIDLALARTVSQTAPSTAVLFSVGAGLEHWLAPQVSTSAVLRLAFARNITNDTNAVGTVNPGLIVTIYLN